MCTVNVLSLGNWLHYDTWTHCCSGFRKENAVNDFRTLIGATNPAEAAEGTIRKLYATSMGENAVHGSDSDENAAIESAFHFSQREIF